MTRSVFIPRGASGGLCAARGLPQFPAIAQGAELLPLRNSGSENALFQLFNGVPAYASQEKAFSVADGGG